MTNSNQKNAKEKVLLKPKYDVVFQTLFSDKNKKETGYLISAILGKKITVLGYSNLKRTITIGLLDYTLSELYDINKMHTVWTFHEEEVVEKKLTNLQELHIIEMEVKSIMKNNDEINETNEKLENISGDEHLKKRAEILERWELEEKWNKQSVFAHGVEEGYQEGSLHKAIEIAKSMLKENLPLDTICKVTGLSVEEVKKLNQD